MASCIGLWVVATTFEFVGPARLPGPKDLWESFEQLMDPGYAGGTLPQQVWFSVRLVLAGFAVAIVTGVPLGILMGMSRRAEALINPAFLVIRPIPPLAWIPLAILWFGLGNGAKIFVIWFGAFVPALINTYTGVRSVDPGLIAAARVHGARPWHVLFEVVVPGALPLIFTGLRLALQASWTALVAAELVGAFYGLGRVLMTAARDIYPGMIAAAMICVALLGASMTYLLGLAEAKATPWRNR
ncbi:MAG: ABC transporter permease [Anaerolineae bacterium]|nr:ABC transporter permease [Anaerolineae bacterium]